jgi:hypothetical protein
MSRFNGPQFKPPHVPGWTAIQTIWGASNHAAIETLAKNLGFEIRHAGGSLPWKYIPDEAIGPIFEIINRSKEDVEASRTINADWISARVVDSRLQINSVHWAETVGLPVRERQGEKFVRLADVGLIADLARKAPDSPCKVTTDDLAKFYQHIYEHSLGGLTEAQAGRRVRGEPDPRPRFPH